MNENIQVYKDILEETISDIGDSIKKQDVDKSKYTERLIHKGRTLEQKNRDRGDSFKKQDLIKKKHNERTVQLHKEDKEKKERKPLEEKERKEGKPLEEKERKDGKYLDEIDRKEGKPPEEKERKEGKPLEDREDNFKKQDPLKIKYSERNNFKSVRKPVASDRGDINIPPYKVRNPHKTNTNGNKNNKDKPNERNRSTIQNEIKPKAISDMLTDSIAATVSNNKTLELNANAENKTKVAERKRISDKVYARLLSNQNPIKDAKKPMKPENRNDRSKTQASLISGSRDVILSKTTSKSKTSKTGSDFPDRDKKDTRVSKKPQIRTVKSKNDGKVFKAVTFTEHKHVKPTVLEINIPNIQTKKTRNILVEKDLDNISGPSGHIINTSKSTSKLSMQEKTHLFRRSRLNERTKRNRPNRTISSPDKFKKIESPPTEVAKWGPSCINAHTKPYYEAWVNTTLAAITKMSKKDKLYLQKENIIKTFQKSLEARPETPDLVHEDYKSELYAGRIKIRHKNMSKIKRQPLITPLLDKRD